MLNNITLTGRLVEDPIEVGNNGTITSFTLANNYSENETLFIKCVCFDKLAGVVASFTQKGSKVAVSGRLEQRDYEDKDGNKRREYRIVVGNLELLDPKKAEDDEPRFDPKTGKPLKSKK